MSAFCCAGARNTTNKKGLFPGCRILWIVHCSFLSGACGCEIIPLPRSGESMRTDPRSTAMMVLASDRPDEARLALRRAVQATLAGLAEMDRLLDQAERLILCQRSGR